MNAALGSALNAPLPAIPLVDVRSGGPPRHALENPAKARALRDACLGSLPRAAHPLVPSFDRISQRWLARSRSPYVDEIAMIAEALDFSGVWLLNASMQWGCTSRARAPMTAYPGCCARSTGRSAGSAIIPSLRIWAAPPAILLA